MSFIMTDLCGFGVGNDVNKIPGLHLWLVADPYFVNSGGWIDYRVNGRTAGFAQSIGTLVTLQYNSKYWVNFNNNNVNSGLSCYMFLDSTNCQLNQITQECQIFVVTRNTGVYSGNETLTGFWNFSTGLNTHHPYQNNIMYDTFCTTVRKDNIFPNVASLYNTWHIYSAASKNGKWGCWMNGTRLFYTETNTFNINSTCTIARRSGNALSGYPYSYTGNFAEILIYNKYLSDSQRVSVENYLRNKYNVLFT